ncbi:protein of unknown function [Maridesulfovibrio hydrothermalis AM13 = DSM 14728]|uniref:Uncharacterized protein n=1 Tax=Maridesulfovibrio hydrothermalis AM13 = DSM 14728 TaxID=1121451 RepID=L0RET5_9BACT|nr:protein of unknown function [Maridesulfovibrio hydrothermalis AM13 = DSM 14728]
MCYNEKKGYDIYRNPLIFMVGMRGFEPPVSASRTQRSTRLSHIPCEIGLLTNHKINCKKKNNLKNNFKSMQNIFLIPLH